MGWLFWIDRVENIVSLGVGVMDVPRETGVFNPFSLCTGPASFRCNRVERHKKTSHKILGHHSATIHIA